MQIKALALAFAALIASTAAVGTSPVPVKVLARAFEIQRAAALKGMAKRDDCPGGICVVCSSYGDSACCSWTEESTGYVILDECESGGP